MIGILLVQLGTPDSATPRAVRRYLKEFLSDRRVVDVNRAAWWLILNGIILNTRPQKSAQLYMRLIEQYGPVLRTYSESLTKKLMTQVSASYSGIVVRHAMRYGNPSMADVLREMLDSDKCDKVLLVPLYPQYSASTTGSTCDALFDVLKKQRFIPALRVMGAYHARHEFLDSLSLSISEALARRETPPDRLIFSYHGLPQRYVDSGDPYAWQCEATTRDTCARLDFPREKILQTYQSRFGKEEWLKPYLDETLKKLAVDGVKDVMVVCPGFSMDCLETLDEIAVEAARLFREHGGRRLELVSCLNDRDEWVKAFFEIIKNELAGWIDT